MSLKQAFIAYEASHNTNPLIAAARAAGVTAKDRDIIKVAEAAAEGVPYGDANRPVRSISALLEQRADEFVAAIAKL